MVVSKKPNRNKNDGPFETDTVVVWKRIELGSRMDFSLLRLMTLHKSLMIFLP